MWRNLSLSRNSTSIFKRVHTCAHVVHVVCRTRDSLAIFSVSLKMSARHRGTFSMVLFVSQCVSCHLSLSLSLLREKDVLTSVQFCFVSIRSNDKRKPIFNDGIILTSSSIVSKTFGRMIFFFWR